MDVDDAIEQKLAMLDCHVSQFYEWLPYNWGRASDVPASPAARRAFLRECIRAAGPPPARFAELFARLYGPDRAARVQWIEAFEPCEYGRPLDQELYAKLFAFVPSLSG
jgi:hypothetical protein